MSSNNRKSKKYRGSKTHGGGSMKKRRGAGSRGGRGKAGTGKRSDNKKPSLWKQGKDAYLGNYGFTSQYPDREVLNVSDLEDQLHTLVQEGVASESDGTVSIDLSDIDIDKLLGGGRLSTELDVTVRFASDSAVRKVEEAGGSITVTDDSDDE